MRLFLVETMNEKPTIHVQRTGKPYEIAISINCANGISGKYIGIISNCTINGGYIYNQNHCVPTREEFREMGLELCACKFSVAGQEKRAKQVMEDFFCED